MLCLSVSFFFFFNDTATTEIYTLSLHDALPVLRSLGRGGRFVSCGGTTGPKVAFDIRRLFWYQWSLMGSTMGNDAEYREIVRVLGAGELRPTIDRVFSFAEARAAFGRLERGEQFGKIAIAISPA